MVDVRATLGPNATLDFMKVYAYCVCSGYRILQETLSGFMYTVWEIIWGGWRYMLCTHYRRQFIEDGGMRYLRTGRSITLWVTYLRTHQPTNIHTYIHMSKVRSLFDFLNFDFLDNFRLPGLFARQSIKMCLKFS